MSDLKEEAERELARAEAVARAQRQRLEALQDPIVSLAAQLHTVIDAKRLGDNERFKR